MHASVLKRTEWKEREAREQQQKHDEELQLGFGATDMTPAELRKIIDSDRRMYYRTEELNDKLYIHYKGWRKIQGLEGWTGLKAFYAECNAFERIQGLQMCKNLRSLFLQENCIRKIEGLENCPELWNINLSNNFIDRIEGLDQCKNLNTLIIAKNKIGHQGVDDVVHLLDTNIGTLDLQDNSIWDPDVLPEVFMRMPELRVLYLKGNPCSKKIPNYRKSVTVYCRDLRYLDDRPVFPEDRRAAEAFNRGGLEEERAERRRIKEEEREKHDRNMKAFSEMIENARREKKEREAMREFDKFTDDTDPVETEDQRHRRMIKKWEEENTDINKDEAQEHAEKCLRSEKEGPQKEEQQPEERPTDAEPPPLGGDRGKTEVDNRKLVYEDIWDDLPPAPARASQKAPEAVVADAARDAPGLAVATAASEVFLPWAAGAAGMETQPPSEGVLERRVGALRGERAQQEARAQTDTSEEAQRPAWYATFAKKMQQEAAPSEGEPAKPLAAPHVVEQRAAEAAAEPPARAGLPAPGGAPKFAPPARTGAGGAAAADAAAAEQQPAPRGELDEMD